MSASKDNPNLLFAANEVKVQSPYLYLQSVGSTAADGSAYGAHLRWLLLRNLGETHLPKGDYAQTRTNFNRQGDYVKLFRSRYVRRFPITVSFFVAPDVVNDALAFWIYKDASTNTVVYIHFRDAAKYAAVRASINPSNKTIDFIQQYCPALIEAELKDKLCFAIEFDVKRDPLTVMRAEALSVETNIPLSPVFVSCRKTFDDNNWCAHIEEIRPQKVETAAPKLETSAPKFEVAAPKPKLEMPKFEKVELKLEVAVPKLEVAGPKFEIAGPKLSAESENASSCCAGPNLLSNGHFENAPAAFGFETDYRFQETSLPGVINLTSNARLLNGAWVGLPHTGEKFLAVDGITAAGKAVIRFSLKIEPQTRYCFAGWLATLWPQDISIPLMFRFTPNEGEAQSFTQATPARVGTWEQFQFLWNSGKARAVSVEIISLSIRGVGNDFGIDDLVFCKGKEPQQGVCHPRILSENIRSVRFEVQDGYPHRLEFETYESYIAGADWEKLDTLALTKDDGKAFSRLEPAPDSINAHWQKFNDHALLNVSNYQDRWTRAGGLRYGVERYVALSDNDPMALDTLQGNVQPQDGSIQISLLDTLRIVSLDFHIARMLGLGYLDRNIANDTDEYLYLCMYDTEGVLDDTNAARLVSHYYMGVPTKPLDYRLPDTPRLKPATYGLTINNGEPQSTYLTDSDGYTPDGLSRYVNLFVEPEIDDAASLAPFFEPPVEFCSTEKTSSVFYGIEYRKDGEADWRKPEIAHDATYKDLDNPPQFETLPLPNNPAPAANPVPTLRHEERESGVHEYGSYGINWFSRVSPVGNIVATDATDIKKANLLLPPSNFAVQLIQKESPLMLTTTAEQNLLAGLSGTDKTLVRVTFDYAHAQDLNYDFADTVELFFRPQMPRNVVGAVKTVSDDPADSHKSVISTTGYMVNSQGTTITPSLDPTLFGNFIGGVLSCQQENYIVTALAASNVAGEGPVFTVQKNVSGTASDPGSTGAFVTVHEYKGPQLDLSSNAQVMFMAVENMADPGSWGTPNPLPTIIHLGDSTWTTHTETYVQDGETITVSLRGVWSSAIVSPEPVAEPGYYRIEFQTYQLSNHPQHANADPVDWYKGVVRVPRAATPNAPKKVLEVLLIEHLGDGQPLVLHVIDNAYEMADQISTGVIVDVNYYPGYRVYLHAAPAHDLTEATIQPAAGEGNRKTWLGARSCDSLQLYYSAVGLPAPIIALEFVTPLAPEQPAGAEFATRPDYYYKSSYNFRLNFAPGHKPYAVAMYRGNDEAILRALYNNTTYNTVAQQLELLGEDDPYRADRWRNLLSFDYVYDVNSPEHPYYDPTGSNQNGEFRKFPAEDGYAFPNPDKGGMLNGSPPSSVLNDLKEAIQGSFTALTELPLIYDFIKDSSYVPVPKPQNIRNTQGALLDPHDPAFDMSPMAKRTDNGFEIQFTDFTLDGTSNNVFFYYGREIGNRGRLGDPGPIAGPVRLINTHPPDAPGVKKMYVQELNPVANIGLAVNFEINSYPAVQNVGRMLIYRTINAADALSVRTMQLVKTVDFAETNQVGELTILLSDDFESGFVPYGDPLFYRIVALRKVKNPDATTDWSPSQPSKLLLTTVIDTINPQAPEITYTSDGLSGTPAMLAGVILSWPAEVHNGAYYLDKMNATGNWVMIYSVKTNDDVTVNLAATELGTNVLPKENPDDDSTVYHRFRVRVENSSGLFNLTDKVLTL